MEEYHKIQTIFKRDNKGNLLEGEWAKPEFEYLKDNEWEFTEKIDGCLHYGQHIITDCGKLPVGTIVNKRLPVKVLSYNFERDVLEFRDIVAYHKEKRVRPFLSVAVKSRKKGNRPKYIVCTDNHQFLSNGEWVEAKDLSSGDVVSHLGDCASVELEQFVLGTLLGDGSIYRTSGGNRGFSFSHSVEQSGYFDFKLSLLGSLGTETKSRVGGYPGSKRIRVCNSIVTPSISNLILEACEEGHVKTISDQWLEKLLPLAIAIWYMDDGSLGANDGQRPRVHFSTHGFLWREVERLSACLKEKYDIDSSVHNYKGPVLVLTADATERLFAVIAPYIHESMKYKLPECYRDIPCVLSGAIGTREGLLETEVISVSNTLPKRAQRQQDYQYDLQIEENSNYFTNDILVHNTNIRIHWDGDEEIAFGGRTDKAQIPPFLSDKLNELFTLDKIKNAFPAEREGKAQDYSGGIIMFGEGYGHRIQKIGHCYIGNGVSFILFDVKVGRWWLSRKDVDDVAFNLGVKSVPIIGRGTLGDMIGRVQNGLTSKMAKGLLAEGIVARPSVEISDRSGKRIITKLKCRDFGIDHEKRG